MHQALDRPAAPGQASRSGYNPLRRNAPHSPMLWWSITGVALLVTLALLAWPTWRPATEPLIPARVQARPAAVSLPPQLAANTVPAPTSEPEQAATMATPVASPPQEISETNQTQAASAAENRNQAKQPETVPVVPEPQGPGSEPPPPALADALPVPADNPPNAATEPVGEASRSAASTTRPAARSSSVATAVPQHDAVRQAVQAAIGQGNLAQAQRLLQSWIEREPRLDEPRIWLAKVYLSRGAMEDAETLLIGLQSTEALGLRGLVLEKTERYADAARVFEALARQEASSPQWWLHWAINLENSGRLTEARLLYQTYLEQFFSHNERLTAFATERYRALAE
ncbi:tetratricopeptide repeat protein [Saccharospirillum sp.]|uniref:tetratricopeptide repeat protein n=1 Tax=Saccharospirillum sp. TaxID=2033801 RepID=UPI0034A0779C